MNVDLYRQLFVHRSDVFAEQHTNGSYTPVARSLTDDEIAEHLEGFASYGVYVIDPEPSGATYEPSGEPFYGPNTVKYVVFDLDTYDADALDFLTRAVERLVAPFAFAWNRTNTHLQCLMLEDSGGKGYHIWLFLNEPVPARNVRAWTEPVRAQYEHTATLAAAAGGERWPALEIFPKQDAVPEGGYGNLVKLPFGVHAKTHARSFVSHRDHWANALNEVLPFPAALIPIPVERSAGQRSADSGEGASHPPTPFACVSRIVEEGAPQGCRDDAMLHLAHYARGCGLPEHLAQEWCDEVNGDFSPPMRPTEVATKVRSAYRMEAPHPSCTKDWLRDFCPGSERLRSCPNYAGPEGGSDRDDDIAEAWLTPEERRAQRRGE